MTDLVNGNQNATSSLPSSHLHADANAVESAGRTARQGITTDWDFMLCAATYYL